MNVYIRIREYIRMYGSFVFSSMCSVVFAVFVYRGPWGVHHKPVNISVMLDGLPIIRSVTHDYLSSPSPVLFDLFHTSFNPYHAYVHTSVVKTCERICHMVPRYDVCFGYLLKAFWWPHYKLPMLFSMDVHTNKSNFTKKIF